MSVIPTRRLRTLLAAASMAAFAPLPVATTAGADPITGQDHPAEVMAVFGWRYLPSTVTIMEGETFRFGNYDFAPGPAGGLGGHSLDEVVPGCTAPPYTKNNAGTGETCPHPRFSSGRVDHGHVRRVAGADELEPGTYEFICQVHPFMRGTLVVQPRRS
ncbi:MAG: hypothetical protein AB1679_16860 [Actinomycetota bacterium]|jgi:hypothetical protein